MKCLFNRIGYAVAIALSVILPSSAAQFTGELFNCWYDNETECSLRRYENDPEESDRWAHDYVKVGGVKHPATWENFLIPVNVTPGEKVTPKIICGTAIPSAVSVKVMSDLEVYKKFINSQLGDIIDEVWPNGAEVNRAWLWVETKQRFSSSVTAVVKTAERPYFDRSRNDFASESMMAYAARYGASFDRQFTLSPSVWFTVGIQESGEEFDKRMYIVHDYARSPGFSPAQTGTLIDTIDNNGGDSGSIDIEGVWYVSAQEAGANEFVIRPSDFTLGTVTGGGIYAPGKMVSMRATAKVAKPATAYAPAQVATVFAGWFADSDFSQPLEAGVDYRTPSLTYVMPAEDVTLYAKFIPASEDTVIALTADDGTDAWDVSTNAAETVFNTSGALELALLAESYSLPKITVSGLPAGLRFTAKPVYVMGSKTEIDHAANTIYGTATKPGTYVVTVKLTNATVKKAIERKFTIVVDNFTGANDLLAVSDREGSPTELLNLRGDKYVISAGVVEFNLPRLLAMNGLDRVTLTGLPSGLKYNATTGAIEGVATRAGTFTVWVRVGIAVSTFTIQVDPLPSWLIGAYECGMYETGWDVVHHAVKFVINATGSVAGKVTDSAADKVETVSFKWNLTRKDEDGAFWIEGYKYDEAPGVISIRIYPTVVDGVEFGRVEAAFEAWGSSGPSNSYTVYMQGAKDVWTKFRAGSTARPLFSQGCSYYFADDDANVFLELVFGNDGNVKVFNYADASDTTAYSTASARLVPYEVQGDSLKAYCSFVIQGRDHAIGLVLELSINTSYGTVYDSDIVVDEYHLQYAD